MKTLLLIQKIGLVVMSGYGAIFDQKPSSSVTITTTTPIDPTSRRRLINHAADDAMIKFLNVMAIMQ
jgi:hypothetical protein